VWCLHQETIISPSLAGNDSHSTLYRWQIPSKLKKPIYSLLKKEPGNEEVNLPCSTTNLPFTITSLIPEGKQCGFLKVALSIIE
jgi:hypothetical protein